MQQLLIPVAFRTHRNPADTERERTYSSAVSLGRQLDELAGNLGTIIGEINSAKGVGALGTEDEKDGGDEDAVGCFFVSRSRVVS